MHTVGPSRDQRVLVLQRERAEPPTQALLSREEQIDGIAALQGERGVPHVVRRQPDVDEA